MKYLQRGLICFAFAFGIAFFMTPKENVDKDTWEAGAWIVSMFIMVGLGTTNVAIAERVFYQSRAEKEHDQQSSN